MKWLDSSFINAPPRSKGKNNEELLHELQRLKEVAEYKRREHLWRERWQRIAFHIRQKGLQIHEIHGPADEITLSEREINNILRPFDKEIPSSGRV